MAEALPPGQIDDRRTTHVSTLGSVRGSLASAVKLARGADDEGIERRNVATHPSRAARATSASTHAVSSPCLAERWIAPSLAASRECAAEIKLSLVSSSVRVARSIVTSKDVTS